MKRALTAMVLFLISSHPAPGDTVGWIGFNFHGEADVFDRYTPGGVDRYIGQATARILYDTPGPTDLTLSVLIDGRNFSVSDPNGYIGWGPNSLTFTAYNPLYGEADVWMSFEFVGPGVPYTGEAVPTDLSGLSVDAAYVSGGTNAGHGWSVTFPRRPRAVLRHPGRAARRGRRPGGPGDAVDTPQGRPEQLSDAQQKPPAGTIRSGAARSHQIKMQSEDRVVILPDPTAPNN
jgi:hypothetical protein